VEQSSVIPENLAELAAEYKRLWPLIPALHARIGKLAAKDAIRACAKRLGMLARQGARSGIHFEHELEVDIFQDYLIYMHRPRGISLVRQMLNRNPYPQGSDERLLLEGMVQARFSLFWIREVLPEGGFLALDVIRGETLLILDQSPQAGDVAGILAGFRVFPFRNAWMHTGANLPMGMIEDAAGLQAMGKILNEQEERELNEANIFRWRKLFGEKA
jgi:hypothetical protein